MNFASATVVSDQGGTLVTEDVSDTAFDVPFIFGIGADIRVGDRSFITLTYDELFAISLDNQGNFSTNISIGYKFEL